jgi:hypothetical protein
LGRAIYYTESLEVTMAASRTIHFPRVASETVEVPPDRCAALADSDSGALPKRPTKNPLQAYRDALVHSNVVEEKLRGLLTTSNRHGDLRAALTYARLIA